MAQLNQFNGGLNTRLAPHLINVNEAQVYQNIDNSSVSLKPLKQDTNENKTVYPYMYNFKDSWVSSSTYRTYQEFQEKLYYSDGIGVPQKSSNGTTWQNLGIKEPLDKPIVSIANDGATPPIDLVGVLDGTIQYCYTYYNIVDGSESAPSGYSNEVVVVDKQIDVTVVKSTDSQVTNIRLYRLGGDLVAMQLVLELSNANQTYTDNIADLDIDGHVLDSFQNQQAPTGLSYLTETNAMLFGAKDDKLYYSDVAYVNSWSSFNFIDFDADITGIGAVPNGLLVFTKYKTYIVTGTSPITLSKYLISSNQGCIEHRTICFASNTLVWVSTDGVCMSKGSDIIVISRDKLGKLMLANISDAVVYDEVYYLAYKNEVLAVDFRFGTIFRKIDVRADGFHIYNDILYYSDDNTLYSYQTSDEYRLLTYKSPKLSDGQISNLKNYKTFYVNCIGSLDLKIYIDGTLVTEQTIDDTTSEVLVPQLKRQGYYVEFELSGKGELLELQYIMEGRQNGR